MNFLSSWKRLLIFFGILVTLLMIITITWASTSENDTYRNIYILTRRGFELVYFTTSVFLLIGLFIGYQQLRITAKEHEKRFDRLSIEKGVYFLEQFASVTIPIIHNYKTSYEKLLKKSYSLSKDIKKYRKHAIDNIDDNLTLNLDQLDPVVGANILKDLIIKQECGLINIFNQLESLSAIIIHNIAKEDIVYDPISNVFCKFINEEIIFLSIMRHLGTPYKNITELYTRWSEKKENEHNALKLKELERMIEEVKRQLATSKLD